MFKRGKTTLKMVMRLAWRSLWRHRRRTLINLSSIGLGLTVALGFTALTEGVYHQLIEDGVRLQAGHLTLEHPGYREAPAVDLAICGVKGLRTRVKQLAGVAYTKPVILAQGIAKSGIDGAGVLVMGVDPGVEKAVSPLARQVTAGAYLSGSEKNQVMVGRRLAENLNLNPGKKVVLSVNNASGELVEELFRVKGVFKTGAEEADAHLIQMPLATARRLLGLGPGCVTQLGVVLKEADDQGRVRRQLESLVKGKEVAVRTWQEISPDLASHVRLDRAANWVFKGLLLVIILFTIVNTVLMSALEREKEFAVLVALGTPPKLLKGQLLLEAAWLGLMGCGVGALLGGGLALALQVWGVDLSAFFTGGGTYSGVAISTRVHGRVDLGGFLGLVAFFQVATTMLGFLPWWRVNRLRLAEILR